MVVVNLQFYTKTNTLPVSLLSFSFLLSLLLSPRLDDDDDDNDDADAVLLVLSN